MQKKRLLRLLVQSLLIILLLELFLRILFYQQVGREDFALLETARNIKRKMTAPDLDRIYKDFLLARPDSGKEVNRMIAEEAFASNHFEYSPWTDYKNSDFSGKYINTKGLVRATLPDSFINPDTTALITVCFFGGSTMYGVNVTDGETIAAAFVNSYKEQYPHGVSIKVINYGIPAYHSYNELRLLTHLVYSGKKPDIAIVLDGLNNFLMPSAVLQRLPYYYYRLKLASNDKINFKELEQIIDSTNTLYENPAGFNEDQLADTLVNEYLSNINHIKKIASAESFKAYFFVQPTPFYNYPNKLKDPICGSFQVPLVGKGYKILEEKSKTIENCLFLGNMLGNEKGYPFIDRFHYSPTMCRKIAKALVAVVGEQINKR